jgi:hypothetical protein
MASSDSLVESQSTPESLVTPLDPRSCGVDEDHLRLLLKLFFDLHLSFQVASEAPLNLLSAVMLFQEVQLGLLCWPTKLHIVLLTLDRRVVRQLMGDGAHVSRLASKRRML